MSKSSAPPRPQGEMTSAERFRKIMRFGSPDRVPYFEEGIRDEVIKAWQTEGLTPQTDLNQLFPTDRRREIQIDLEPLPRFENWPICIADLDTMRDRLDHLDPGRFPENWSDVVRSSKTDGQVNMLRVHRGFFQSMGVQEWDRFHKLMQLTVYDPEFVRQAMLIQGQFSARLVERVLNEIQIDAAIFSEPIGGNDRPLISPKMYEELVLKSYSPILEALNRGKVHTVIFRTYANAKILIPSILKWGFNCLWACEVNAEAMDYRTLRREFGPDLRLIGGIDLDALRQGKAAIKRELHAKIPPLLIDGGYVPMADGRVREDVPFKNYIYYRRLLKKITKGL